MRQSIWRAGYRLAPAFAMAMLLGGVMTDRTLAQAPIAPGKVVSGTLSFDGHATMGDFTGTTTTLTGYMSGGPELASIQGWVEAPVGTLVTGKGKRDADLNKSMESDKYPVIRYELDSLTPGHVAGDTTEVVLHGRFVIHGVTRDADLPGRVLLDGTGARVRADAPLNLKDYRIGGLSKMLGMLKMHEDIEVHVDVAFGSDVTPGTSSLAAPRTE
jgi:polyisoprenoid-binding protein YceI